MILEKGGCVMRSLWIVLGLMVAAFGLSACITVNVNFPEAAVQQASDNYVQQLYQMQREAEQRQQQSNPEKRSQSNGDGAFYFPSLGDLLWPKAYADQNFRMDHPSISEIQKRQVDRLARIDGFKSRGFIGESAQGLLVLRGEPRQLERRQIEGLIEAENQDRQELYKRVLELNGLPSDQIAAVAARFARSFQDASPAKTPIEAVAGRWETKPE